MLRSVGASKLLTQISLPFLVTFNGQQSDMTDVARANNKKYTPTEEEVKLDE